MTTADTTAQTKPEPSKAEQSEVGKSETTAQAEKILCSHCKRTASNGLKCLGICVADSDY